MNQSILNDYESLNNETKEIINTTIKALSSDLQFTTNIPDADKAEILKKRNEEKAKRQREREASKNHLKKLTEKCDHMKKQDYIDGLNEVFETLETYKLRWFYIFIMERLKLDHE